MQTRKGIFGKWESDGAQWVTFMRSIRSSKNNIKLKYQVLYNHDGAKDDVK